MWAEKSIKNNKTTKTVMFYASHLIFSALDDILKSHVRCTGKCGYCWNVVMPHRAPTGANNTQTNSNTEGSKKLTNRQKTVAWRVFTLKEQNNVGTHEVCCIKKRALSLLYDDLRQFISPPIFTNYYCRPKQLTVLPVSLL